MDVDHRIPLKKNSFKFIAGKIKETGNNNNNNNNNKYL